MSNVSLSALSAAALVSLYNGAIEDFGAPEGFAAVTRFASKAKGATAIEALCAAGNLAVTFEGDNAVIVDASEGDDDGEGEGDVAAFGDGKGKVRAWGFTLASDEYLKANPRGTPEREAYRKARRKAARLNRRAERAAKEALHAETD